MYVVPQYFLFSTMMSVIGFPQQWIMVSASALSIGKRLFHVGECFQLGYLTHLLIAIYDPTMTMRSF
jgi:hypothetical protein